VVTETRQPTRRHSLWRSRDFRLLWAGQSVSELGSQITVLAIPLVAIDGLHAGPLAIGTLTAMSTLPFLLVGLPAGAWVDRLRRRPVLIAADVGRAIVLATIPAAWALSALTLAQLYVVALVSGVLTVFFDVAYQSYLPVLVARDRLVEGNGKLAATQSGAQVAGPAAAGALVGAVGAAWAVLADAATFVVSFVSLIAIRAPEEAPVRRKGDDGSTLRAEIAEGLRFVWHEPRIRSVAGATGTSNFFSTMAAAVILLFLRREIHLTAGHIGVLLGLGSTGGVLGAVLAGRLAARIGVGPTILSTIAVAGLGALAYPLVTAASADVLVVAGGLLSSAGAVAYNINQVSLRQALCPLPLQGRMNASVRFLVWGTMPLGGLAGGLVGSTLGLRPALWAAGIGEMTAFLWVLFSPVPSVRTIPDQEPDGRAGLEAVDLERPIW
jgi:MFS family permease